MKKLAPAILIIATMAGVVSCKKETIGDGPVSTETRTVTNFTAIDLQMNGSVYYKNEPTWKVEVTAKESIHPILETRVVNNRLVIRYTNGRMYDADESIRINIAGPGVNKFELNTSGSIYVVNTIHQPDIVARSKGSGNILFQHIDADNIDAESIVSGHISAISGFTQNATYKTDGSGKIDFSAIEAKNSNAHIIGSGSIRMKVSDLLIATIDGSGSIYFSGNPFVISDVSGSGRLIHY